VISSVYITKQLSKRLGLCESSILILQYSVKYFIRTNFLHRMAFRDIYYVFVLCYCISFHHFNVFVENFTSYVTLYLYVRWCHCLRLPELNKKNYLLTYLLEFSTDAVTSCKLQAGPKQRGACFFIEGRSRILNECKIKPEMLKKSPVRWECSL